MIKASFGTRWECVIDKFGYAIATQLITLIIKMQLIVTLHVQIS